MGFHFGLIGSISPFYSFVAFICTISFIICFDYLTGILEYFLQNEKFYSRIVQVIYKELMIMGVISFSIVMYEATHNLVSPNEEQIIVAIDFAHIVLFYLTIFFVLYALYLIVISLHFSFKYRQYDTYSIIDLVESVERNYESLLGRLTFRMKYLPLSSHRNVVEYKMIQSIFNASYLVPPDFNFAGYLNGCFLRYALKTVNRSFLTWFLLIASVGLNYIRLGYVDYSCAIRGSIPVARKRSLSAENVDAMDRDCRITILRTFLAFGAILSLFSVILLGVSRLYKIRLVNYSFLFFLYNIFSLPSSFHLNLDRLRTFV